jgi:hypothetical protein
MAALCVNIKEEGQGSLEALLRALATAGRVEALAVRNCGAANMRALADAMRRHPLALSSISALFFAADDSRHFDERWQLGNEGAEVLKRLLPQLKNLSSLVLKCKSRSFSSLPWDNCGVT